MKKGGRDRPRFARGIYKTPVPPSVGFCVNIWYCPDDRSLPVTARIAAWESMDRMGETGVSSDCRVW